MVGPKQAIFEDTQAMTRVVERWITEDPTQWLWLHNRWKSAFDEWNRERAFPEGIPSELLNRWQDSTVPAE